ncbi:hypothetical protein C0584_03155 [Candidatus Parcubacteria bacterium]|nr:MAG: hypothetical protein C0584_03155 [Candidatus Parcubacteria bacterium]
MKKFTELIFAISKSNSIISRKMTFNGLDFSDYMILSFLDESKEKKLMRVELAEKMGLSPSGITRMLLPLEKTGLIQTEEGEDDARARYAKLTKAGEETIKDADYSIEILLDEYVSKKNDKAVITATNLLNSISQDFIEEERQAEAKSRWGNTKAYKQSKERMKKMSKEEVAKIKEDSKKFTQKIADNSNKGVKSKEIQELIEEHYQSIQAFYDCSFEMYLELGEMYVRDPRFASYYDGFQPGLSRFMRNAIKEFVSSKNKK